MGFALCLVAGIGVRAEAPAGNFLSSLKQAFNQDFDREVVRGHFDVGSPPDAHRYYCLVDAKTGKSEANGVGGQTALRPDGMTGIKAGAVSLYSCAAAEQQGILVTTGYVLNAAAARMTAPMPPHEQAEVAAAKGAWAEQVDVAGVKLGMSPAQVRAVLKSKMLLNNYESAETLRGTGSPGNAIQPRSARFVNMIAAWTPASSSAAEGLREDGESYEVMFTPVPGQERAVAIVHSAAPVNAIRETAVERGLVTKYGGFSATDEVPPSPTWRIQSDGKVVVGDPCGGHAIFGGLGETNLGVAPRRNRTLTIPLDEFKSQIERCGVAIVTEDHSPANAEAPRGQRLVTRFTVTAYSPSIGFEGATTAAQLIRTARDTADKATPRPKDQPAPNL